MISSPWDSAQNLLCLRLDGIGDLLMTTPALRALKHGLGPVGQRRLTLLTSPAAAAVAPLIPELDAVLVYDAPWIKATAHRRNSQPELEMVECLRRGQFDGAVIFNVFTQNPLPAAFLCYLAEIPLRLAHCHENPYQLLTDWVLDPEPARGIRHEVRRQLDLVGSIGCQTQNQGLSLQVPKAAHWSVLARLKSWGLQPPQPWVVIHPGATALSRRYSPEGFAEVGRRLILDLGLQVVFTGLEAERSLVTQIQTQIDLPTYSLVGGLNLGELAALIAIAPLLIANNSGPVHIAAAVGTPVVDLYALTNPQHTPWQVPHRVLFQDVPCKFCYKSICPEGHAHCLQQVTHSAIVQAARELLNLSALAPTPHPPDPRTRPRSPIRTTNLGQPCPPPQSITPTPFPHARPAHPHLLPPRRPRRHPHQPGGPDLSRFSADHFRPDRNR